MKNYTVEQNDALNIVAAFVVRSIRNKCRDIVKQSETGVNSWFLPEEGGTQFSRGRIISSSEFFCFQRTSILLVIKRGLVDKARVSDTSLCRQVQRNIGISIVYGIVSQHYIHPCFMSYHPHFTLSFQ